MSDIFISYTRANAAIAERLATAFSGQGMSVFYDSHLESGDSWDRRIEEELSAARAVVVLWSAESRDRQWVRNEAREGLKRGILCPALVEACELPVEFSHVQAVDLTGWSGDPGQSNFSQLLESVSAKVRGKGTATAPSRARTPFADLTANLELPEHIAFALDRALHEISARQAQFDIRILHPEVRSAVENARRAEAMGCVAEHKAMYAAERAQEWASLARTKQPGTHVYKPTSKFLYEGQSRSGGGRAYGVVTHGGDFNGDTYAGSFDGVVYGGYGIYSYAQNKNNSTALRISGEFLKDAFSGYGVSRMRDGRRYAGQVDAWKWHGFGAVDMHDGARWEGQYLADCVHLGAWWWADHRIFRAGVFAKDGQTLSRAIGPQG